VVLVTMPEYLTEQERPDLIVNPTGWLGHGALHGIPVVTIPIPVNVDVLATRRRTRDAPGWAACG
jgi:hypothetical protein